MRVLIASPVAWLLLVGSALPQAVSTDASTGPSTNAPSSPPSRQMLVEQKHFLDCLAYVYSPGLWISYQGSLYFAPRTETQWKQLEALKDARSKYLALTNRELRHSLTAQALSASGLDTAWQQKLLLPYSETNQDLTPTLRRPVILMPQYEVLQTLPGGDALLRDKDAVCFVMDFGRGAADIYHTNALLIREGTKTYTTVGGNAKTVDAFTDVALNREEIAILRRAVVGFQRSSAALVPRLANSKATQEFESYKAKANDDSPFMEYMLARCYLEGNGTDKNEKLGLEWMNRAAKNGSGDAKEFLATYRSGTAAPSLRGSEAP